MEQMKAKVCLCGDHAVGKTSLIARFVHNVFGDKYIRTIGTKITSKEVIIDDPNGKGQINFIYQIWDIMGQRDYRNYMKDSYFYGCKGCIMVFDLTRPETLHDLDNWYGVINDVAGNVPAIVMANKVDLKDMREVDDNTLERFCGERGFSYHLTSAKSGDNVEDSFEEIGLLMLGVCRP